jgi:hypothetical protein
MAPCVTLADSACIAHVDHDQPFAAQSKGVKDWLGSALPTDVSLIGQVAPKRICTSTVRWLSNKEFQIGMG